MNKSSGFSLIELLVAVSVFSIVMLAISGLIVNGLQVRKVSEEETRALNYANAVLEQYKSYWIDAQPYKEATYPPNSGATGLPQDPPAGLSVDSLTFDCVAIDGSVIPESDCDLILPPLRRISIAIKNSEDSVIADLSTEIGNPVP